MKNVDLPADPRAALATLIAERKEDFAGLSRMIGRNASYIQQYVKRGTPRILAEADRRRLARYFDVSDAVLGGPVDDDQRGSPSDDGRRSADLVAIPPVRSGGLCRSGGAGKRERRVADFHFPVAMLRALGVRSLAALSLVRVRGDSMLPALGDGDDVLVDRDDAADRVRNGVYVLRHDESLLVKRVRLERGGGFSVLSDNRTYPSWRDADPARFAIVGRVLWSGGRLR